MRIPIDELSDVLRRVLLRHGFTEPRAALCARLFAEAGRDGVYSHGLNRFPRFVAMIRNGDIDVDAEPQRLAGSGPLEQWNGRLGPGNLNAEWCMDRALVLSEVHGIGCVALRNTNHWMRGGSYGWQAANAGKIGMCWTNTNQNTPPWGAKEPRIGNNPLIIAIPRREGHVVLDMAMAQFSYGALSSYQLRGEQLPVAGGFDIEGNLTTDPAAIEAAGRPLPIGFWKGSGLAIALDLLAAILSGGRATKDIPNDPMKEVGLSQVFVAWDYSQVTDPGMAERIASDAIEHLHGALPADPDGRVRYPGERTLEIRKENLENGVPVEPSIWEQVKEMV